MTEKKTYRNKELFPPPEEEITFRDMLILALQIQKDMKRTKKLVQTMKDGITQQRATAINNPKPKQNTVSFMNRKMLSSDWMTTEEVSLWLRKSKRTLQNYRNDGKIPFERFNGCIYYSKREIEKYFEKYEAKNSIVK